MSDAQSSKLMRSLKEHENELTNKQEIFQKEVSRKKFSLFDNLRN